MPGMLRQLSRRFSKKNVAAPPAATSIRRRPRSRSTSSALPPPPPLAADGETVHLKVLRGQGLIARDEVALGTSDAYCIVYVDGVLVGKALASSRAALNPLFSDGDADGVCSGRPSRASRSTSRTTTRSSSARCPTTRWARCASASPRSPCAASRAGCRVDGRCPTARAGSRCSSRAAPARRRRRRRRRRSRRPLLLWAR